MRILLTNDDGIDAPGLTVLRHALAELPGGHELAVVAPAEPQSAMSHAITMHRPVRVERREGIEPVTGLRYEGWAVHGRPADCVKLAHYELLKGKTDLVISGINAGANIGIHVLYSGTVGAAREAAFLGTPSIAVSVHLREEPPRWLEVARHARETVAGLIAQPLDASTVMNVNVPALDGGREPRGVRVVPLNTSPSRDGYEKRELPDGATEYRMRHGLDFREDQPDTDVSAVFDRWITVTPLHFDLTCEVGMRDWPTRINC